MNVHIRYWHWQPVSFKLNEQWAPAPKHLGMCQMWCYRYAFLFFFDGYEWIDFAFFFSPLHFPFFFWMLLLLPLLFFLWEIFFLAYASDVDVQCGVVWCNAIYPRKKRTMVKLKIHCSYWRWVSEVMEGVRKYESKRESSGFCQVDGVLNCTNADRHVRVIECRQMQLSPSLSL